ncbi:MAG TPA: Crp/Fnr family transcriptional regulator, partial [Anaerolineaceae bacterium]
MEVTNPDLARLKQLPLLRGLSEADLQMVLAEGRLRSLGEDEFIFYQGDPAGHVYVLLDGQIKLAQLTPDGQQVILNMIGAGEVFGLIAFTQGRVYPVSAQAESAVRVLSWDREALARISSRYPQVSLNAVGLMAEKVGEFQGQIRALATERVERRLARALLRLTRQVGKKTAGGVLIDLNITRQDLAEMSGTTLFTVSRLLSQWERQGL